MAKETEKTYFEQLKENAEKVAASASERGPELGVGPQPFTIIGGTHGEKEGREWSAIVARHNTNGYEYRLFYNLYWPLKEGELEERLNVDTFNWIVGFDPKLLTGYKEKNFDAFFNSLVGRSYEINYVVNKKMKVVVDFKTLPILLDVLEETLTVDEIDFDSVK
jgi:hypothetical protein